MAIYKISYGLIKPFSDYTAIFKKNLSDLKNHHEHKVK